MAGPLGTTRASTRAVVHPALLHHPGTDSMRRDAWVQTTPPPHEAKSSPVQWGAEYWRSSHPQYRSPEISCSRRSNKQTHLNLKLGALVGGLQEPLCRHGRREKPHTLTCQRLGACLASMQLTHPRVHRECNKQQVTSAQAHGFKEETCRPVLLPVYICACICM